MRTTDIEVCPQDVHNVETSAHTEAPKGDQYAGLRRVAGPIPWLLFLICVVEVWQTHHRRYSQQVLTTSLVR